MSQTQTPWWLHDDDSFEMRDGWVVPKDSLAGCRGIMLATVIGGAFWTAVAVIVWRVLR